MKYPSVAIIILNWNGINDTIECLDSILQIKYPDYNIIVVDNKSEGDDVTVLRNKLGSYIHIIENDKNYGFAEGNNIGIRYAIQTLNPSYILLLNNDTLVDPDFLDELVTVAESETEIGIVSPKIYYHDFNGRNDIIWFAGGRINWKRIWLYPHIGWNEADTGQYQSIASVDWASGAAIMIKRYVIEKLPLFDSGYFFGNEDVEYCIKARKFGFKIVYVPTAIVWHKVASSRQKLIALSKGQRAHLFNLYSHYRLVKRNFPLNVVVYQSLLLPVILFRWFISYLLRYRDKDTMLAFFKCLLPEKKQRS